MVWVPIRHLDDLIRLSLLLLAKAQWWSISQLIPQNNSERKKRGSIKWHHFLLLDCCRPPAPNLATNKHWLKKRWEGKDICHVSSSLSVFSYTVILNVTWTKVISVWGNQAFLFLLASANSSPRSFLSSPLQVLFLSQARKCPERNEKRICFSFS